MFEQQFLKVVGADREFEPTRLEWVSALLSTIEESGLDHYDDPGAMQEGIDAARALLIDLGTLQRQAEAIFEEQDVNEPW